jgi:hypothetical protein
MPGKVRDLKGRRFGRLIVRELENVRGHAYWRCRCDCGADTVVRSQKLTSGRIVSCGCFKADPAVRQAARMRTPAARRRQIARLGAAARSALRMVD